MGFQVAAVAPSPCARSSSASSSPSTSSRQPHGLLSGGCAGVLARYRSPVNWGAGVMVRRRPARTPLRCALSASLDGMGAGDAEFLRRIEELAAAAGCVWPASVERSASSVGLPLSLRMLKRKKQQREVKPLWDERLLGSAGESVGRAFSSMVLIVRELQSFALQQMRDVLLCGDDLQLQGVLARVEGEMHAFFVWLFQHIFAGTPALMVSLMLLLANFTVHSMGNSVAAAAATIPPPPPAVSVLDTLRSEPSRPRFDAGAVKTFSVGCTASVDGNSGGGGGKVRPAAGATGDGRWDESLYRLSRVAPEQSAAPAGTGAGEAVPDADEQAIWEMMVSEASRMQASSRADELSDPDVLGNLVAPVQARLEMEDLAEHARTRQRYELAAAEEPNNSLILSNFAQFLYLVMLMELFASKYRSVKGAKVIIDANTGRSRGYGFVRFGDDNDKTHAMTEMNGVYCSTRSIRVGPATPRRSSGDSGFSPPRQSDADSTNRTVYVGGLDPNVSEEELRKAFAKYGDLASVKIPVGKQCGFVQFVNRADAEEALQGLNGSTIGKQAVRLSWGRSPASKQSGGDNGHRRNGMYYGTPFYGGYGYASPVLHPNMYPAAYGAYPYYGNQQLVS